MLQLLHDDIALSLLWFPAYLFCKGFPKNMDITIISTNIIIWKYAFVLFTDNFAHPAAKSYDKDICNMILTYIKNSCWSFLSTDEAHLNYFGHFGRAISGAFRLCFITPIFHCNYFLIINLPKRRQIISCTFLHWNTNKL